MAKYIAWDPATHRYKEIIGLPDPDAGNDDALLYYDHSTGLWVPGPSRTNVDAVPGIILDIDSLSDSINTLVGLVSDLYDRTNRIGVHAANLGGQSVAAGAGPTTLTWTSEIEDIGGWINPTASTFTVPSGPGGIYTINFRWVNTNGGYNARYGFIHNSGTNYDFSSVVETYANSGPQRNYVAMMPLAGGDTLSFYVKDVSVARVIFHRVFIYRQSI